MKTKLLCAVLCSLFFTIMAFGQTDMITQIYTDVSAENGALVNWEKVRSAFVEEAVIVLKTSREASTQFTVDEFIQDFKDFYQSPAVKQYGFKEEVLRLKAEVIKNMAFIAVVYASSFPNADRPPQKGIDFWLLIRKDQSWKVVAVTNEIILPGEEIPAMFE